VGQFTRGAPELSASRAFQVTAYLVNEVVDLLLGADQVGLGPRCPRCGPPLRPAWLPPSARGRWLSLGGDATIQECPAGMDSPL